MVSGDLLFQIKQFGGADALGALQELIDKAKASGVSLADLAKGSATDAEILRSVFGKASEGNQQGVHGFSGELSETLNAMDDNLARSINSLQTAQ